MDSSRLLVFLGLSFTSITAVAAVYLLLRKDEEAGHEDRNRSSRRSVITVKVPNELIGTVIGRGGCTIRAIQEKSGARINCNDESSTDKYRVVTIQGAPESAQLAEIMIHEIIMNQPLILTHEMWVPTRACGRIIGRGGETIRSMTQASCAKIMVDSTGDNERAEKRVLLKGTSEQISLAKTLIEEKVKEEEDMHRRMEMSVANRSPRREPRDNFNYLMAPPNDQEEQSTPCRTERFDSRGYEGFFDVFVSASNNPGKFWVQLVNPRGVELDQLVEKMTEYYTKPENQELHALKEICVGQIVAAPFHVDDKWYRAEILEIRENDYDPNESNVTLYYGDYGDEADVKRKCVFDLRTDFLTLYFQAIECTLAHVKPHGEAWSDEATNLFDELAEVALWQKKLAHVVTYRDNIQKRGLRAGSPIPVIELHDKNVNIGEELVKQGFAVWESSSPTQKPDEPSNASNTSSHSGDQSSSTHRLPPEHLSNLELSPPSDFASQPLKMGPAASFVAESNVPSPFNGQGSNSFIAKEQNQKQGSGFKPKTLESSKKKPECKNNVPVEVVCVPERFSDDDSDDGFTLG